jgi:hypothetical protein
VNVATIARLPSRAICRSDLLDDVMVRSPSRLIAGRTEQARNPDVVSKAYQNLVLRQ